MKLELLVLLLAVYNIWYGAICYILLGIPGLLLGSIFMVCGSIIGVLVKDYKIKLETIEHEM